MDVQGGLIQKGLTSDDTQILKPTAEGEARIHRDKAADGAGTYRAKLNTGVEEIIGGPGVGSLQLAVNVTSPDGLALTANAVGGVAPYTYDWAVRSKFINGTDIAFSGATNLQVANINNGAASYDGTVSVLVTDANGRRAYGYWHTRKDVVIP